MITFEICIDNALVNCGCSGAHLVTLKKLIMMVKISFLHYVAAVIHTPNRNTVAGVRARLSGVNDPIFTVDGSWSL